MGLFIPLCADHFTTLGVDCRLHAIPMTFAVDEPSHIAMCGLESVLLVWPVNAVNAFTREPVRASGRVRDWPPYAAGRCDLCWILTRRPRVDPRGAFRQEADEWRTAVEQAGVAA